MQALPSRNLEPTGEVNTQEITHGRWGGDGTNVTSFNGRSQEAQITDAGDTGEEGLLEMVCL